MTVNPITQVELTGTKKDSRLILRNLFSIAFPAFVNTILFSMANFLDTIMVGKLGTYAIAAVGIVFQPLLILSMFGVIFAASVTTMVAQYKGKTQYDKIGDVVLHGLLFTAVVSLLPFVAGLLFAEPIVLLMDAKADTVLAANLYFKCILWGFIPFCLNGIFTGALLGAGDTKKVLLVNLFSNITNLVLNYILINGYLGLPALGIAGAGIATAVSYFVGCIASFAFCLGGSIQLKGVRHFRPKKAVLTQMLHIGVPVFWGRTAIRLGVFIMVRLVTSMGTLVFAAHQICCRIHDFSLGASDAVGTAASSVVGQSVGAGRNLLAKKYFNHACAITSAVTIGMGIGVLLGARPLVGLFSDEAGVFGIVFPALVVLVIFQPFQGVTETLAGGLAGLGKTKPKAIASTVGIVVLRPLFTLLFTQVFAMGLPGIWLATAIDEISRFVVLLVYYRKKVDWNTVAMLR